MRINFMKKCFLVKKIINDKMKEKGKDAYSNWYIPLLTKYLQYHKQN